MIFSMLFIGQNPFCVVGIGQAALAVLKFARHAVRFGATIAKRRSNPLKPIVKLLSDCGICKLQVAAARRPVARWLLAAEI
jgi:hypothetical protein